MVSVLVFYSDDPSSNTTEAYKFFCKIVFEKNENKQKEAVFGPLKNKFQVRTQCYFWKSNCLNIHFQVNETDLSNV